MYSADRHCIFRAATAQQLFHVFQSKRAALVEQQQSLAPAEGEVEVAV
jgi:hypothetical protein